MSGILCEDKISAVLQRYGLFNYFLKYVYYNFILSYLESQLYSIIVGKKHKIKSFKVNNLILKMLQNQYASSFRFR